MNSQACPWLFTWLGQEFYVEYLSDICAEPRMAAMWDRNYPGQPFLWEWSPIDVGEPRAILSSTHQIFVVSADLCGLVTNSCNSLVICNKDVSTSNSNPGLVMTRGVNFWDILCPRNSAPTACAVSMVPIIFRSIIPFD